MFKNIAVTLSANVAPYRAQLAAASRATRDFANDVAGASGKAAQGWRNVGVAFVATGALIVGSLGASVNAAAQFESRMRNVATINRDLASSEAQFAATSQQVLAISRDLGVSANTLAEGLYDVASSGFQGAAGMEILTRSAEAGRAGLASTAVAAKAITGVLNAYGLTAADAADVSDILFQTVNLGVITFDELAQGVGDWIGSAHAAGVSFDEASAALAAMTLSGVTAAESGTSLNRVILSFIKPSQEMSSALNEIGYESGTAALKALGLQGVMVRLAEAGFDDVESMQALFPEVRGLRGALALAANDGNNFARTMDGIADPVERARATQRALAEQSKSLSFQIDTLKASVSSTAIEVGTELLPVAKTLVDVLGTMFAGFTSIVHALGPFAPVLLGVAGATALTAGSFLLLAPRIAATTAALGSATIGAVSAATAFRGLLLATGGIGIALTAVSLVVGIFGSSHRAAQQDVENFTQALKEEADGAKGAVDALIAKRIVEEDMDVSAKNLGISTTLLIDAIKGEAGALDELGRQAYAARDAGRGTTEDFLNLAAGIDDLGGSLEDAIDSETRTTAALEATGHGADGTAEAFGGYESAAEQATAATDAFEKAVDAVLGKAFSVQEAIDDITTGMIDAASNIATARGEFGALATDMRSTTEQGVANRDMWRGLVENVADAVKAMQEQGATGPQIAAFLEAQRRRLNELGRQMGFNISDVEDFTSVLNDLEGTYGVTVEADTSKARENVSALIGDLMRARALAEQHEVTRFQNRVDAARSEVSSVANIIDQGNAAAYREAAGGGGGATRDPADIERERRRTEDESMSNRFAYGDIDLAAYQRYLDQRLAQETKFTADWATIKATQDRLNQTIGAAWLAAAAAQSQAEDNMYEHGRVSAEKYRQTLVERFQAASDAYGYWSNEAQQIYDQIVSLDSDVMNAYLEGAARQYEAGVMTRDQYRDVLTTRLADLEQFSDEWQQITDQITALDEARVQADQERADVMFEQGAMTTEAYLAELRKRLAAADEYTREWGRIQDQITAIEEREEDERERRREERRKKREAARKEAMRVEDVRFAVGDVDAVAYRAILEARLAAAERFGDEWYTTWQQIMRIDEDAAKSAEDAAQAAADAAQRAADEAAAAASAALDRVKQIADAVRAAHDAAANPIRETANIVSAFSGQLRVATGDVLAYLRHQAEGVTRWRDALTALNASGLDRSILSTLTEAGPQALGLAQALQQMIATGDLEGVNALVDQIRGIADEVGDMHADNQTQNIANDFADLADEVAAGVTNIELLRQAIMSLPDVDVRVRVGDVLDDVIGGQVAYPTAAPVGSTRSITVAPGAVAAGAVVVEMPAGSDAAMIAKAQEIVEDALGEAFGDLVVKIGAGAGT